MVEFRKGTAIEKSKQKTENYVENSRQGWESNCLRTEKSEIGTENRKGKKKRKLRGKRKRKVVHAMCKEKQCDGRDGQWEKKNKNENKIIFEIQKTEPGESAGQLIPGHSLNSYLLKIEVTSGTE